MEKCLYTLEHIYNYGENNQHKEMKMMGIYSSVEKAKAAIARYYALPGFRDYPIECFHVEKFKVDTSRDMSTNDEYFLSGDR